MTALVAVTCRVQTDPRHGERRDALDQRWIAFLNICGLTPLVLPNNAETALRLLDAVPVRGLLLTGGNSLAEYSGDAPERDAMEQAAIGFFMKRKLPVMGVCRGMQVLLHRHHIPLQQVMGHAGTERTLDSGRRVNSYHDYGAIGDAAPFEVTERADDGVIKAVRLPSQPVFGIMWHPERVAGFDALDIAFFRRVFLGESA